MSFFELLGLLLWIGSGIAGAIVLHTYLGATGSCIGFVLGMGLVYMVYKALFAALDVWIPEFPPCQCGRNTGGLYEFQEWKKTEQGNHIGALYICRECRRRYLKTQRRLQEIFTDGSLKSHMHHAVFGRWKRA